MAHVTPSRIHAKGLSAKTRHAFHLLHQLIDGNPRTASQIERSRNSLPHSGQIVRVCYIANINKVSRLLSASIMGCSIERTLPNEGAKWNTISTPFTACSTI